MNSVRDLKSQLAAARLALEYAEAEYVNAEKLELRDLGQEDRRATA